jgi:transposase-like protein
MYSYEDRLRAVKLYIRLGKRVGVTLRQLGYPTQNALKSWYREYARCLDLHADCVRQPKYTETQKAQAVKHYRENGCCLAVTIKALGYPCRDLLLAWVHGQRPGARTRVVGRFRELSPATKKSAVIALCMREGSAQAVAQALGVSRPSLYIWKNQLLGHDPSASMNRSQDSSPNPQRDELEQQLKALRQEVRRLQLEHDLLKKALNF